MSVCTEGNKLLILNAVPFVKYIACHVTIHSRTFVQHVHIDTELTGSLKVKCIE